MEIQKIEEVLFDINGKLASIETKLDSMSENILKHEARITTLEQNLNKHIAQNQNNSESDFKMEMIRLLGKCLLIGISSIATLVGAGGILAKIFGA